MCRPPATTDRRPRTTTPAEADSNLATGHLDPPRPEVLRHHRTRGRSPPPPTTSPPKEPDQAHRSGAHITRSRGKGGPDQIGDLAPGLAAIWPAGRDAAGKPQPRATHGPPPSDVAGVTSKDGEGARSLGPNHTARHGHADAAQQPHAGPPAQATARGSRRRRGSRSTAASCRRRTRGRGRGRPRRCRPPPGVSPAASSGDGEGREGVRGAARRRGRGLRPSR